MTTLHQRYANQCTDERHHNWRGDQASYFSIHRWLYARKGHPDRCQDCGATKEEITIQWANISGQYKRDVDDYKPLCVPCHKRYDRFKKYGNRCRKGHDLTDPANVGIGSKSAKGIQYITCLACRRESIKTPEYRKKHAEKERIRRAKKKGLV